jgi:hypothetical protein
MNDYAWGAVVTAVLFICIAAVAIVGLIMMGRK